MTKKIRQVRMVICPSEKWEMVGGKMNAINNVIANSNFGGRFFPELSQTMAINAARLITNQRLLACWRGKRPIGQKMPMVTGIHIAVPIS